MSAFVCVVHVVRAGRARGARGKRKWQKAGRSQVDFVCFAIIYVVEKKVVFVVVDN